METFERKSTCSASKPGTGSTSPFATTAAATTCAVGMGCSTGEALLHECALALKEVADYHGDPVASGQHPLYALATYVRGLTDNTLTEKQAKALSVFVRHAWRLDRDQLLTLVRWLELLGDSIQSRKRA